MPDGKITDDGGYICEVPAATYRKRLSRARSRVRDFLTTNCGLISPTAPCPCSKRVDVAVRLGRVDFTRLEFTDITTSVNDELVRFHDAADLLRCLPPAKANHDGRGRHEPRPKLDGCLRRHVDGS